MAQRQENHQPQRAADLGSRDRLSDSPASRGVNRVAVFTVCGLLLLAVFVVFGQTVAFEFVNFDDGEYVSDNPHLTHGLTGQSVAWAFTTNRCHNWHPLTWLSYMLDYQFYGPKPWGYHLTNVLLHAATAILLLLVLWRLTGDFWPSAFVAAVFAVHPLRAESVAWVSERKDVLSGLFFMLTLGAYVGCVRRPFSLLRYLGVVALFALGLMAKPMLVTLPFVLLLLDYWPLERMAIGWRRLVAEKLPLMALSAASCVVTPWAQGTAIERLDILPLSTRIANASISYVTYLWQLFCPARLAAFYPPQPGGSPPWYVVGALLLLVCICIGAVMWRRSCPYLFVGWFWYLGMLVPVIGLVQVGGQLVADRYTYLPQIGLAIGLAWGAKRALESWPRYAELCSIVAGLAIAVLMGCARQQTSYWQNSDALWSHAISCTSPNARAHCDLAMALAGKGRTDEAVAQYEKALAIQSNYADAHNNLGVILAERGQRDEAVVHFRAALTSNPDYALAHCNYGLALTGYRRFDEAIAEYEKALQLQPDYAVAHNNCGLALAASGRPDEAIAEFEKALQLQPNYAMAHNNLGRVLAGRGRLDEAITHFRKAVELKPDFAEASQNLAVALGQKGQSN
jgi:tetratricopeptide (TPR) repeat protein